MKKKNLLGFKINMPKKWPKSKAWPMKQKWSKGKKRPTKRKRKNK